MARGRKMDMKDLIYKNLSESIAFGIIMTIIGFFRGDTVFTFPPVWLDLLRLFLIYGVSFFVLSVLFDLIYWKLKKDKK